jgi:hypothetical protein
VFFDEVHSVVQHLFFSDTLRSKRRAVMKTIRWLLRNAGQVIVMDNEITDIDLAVLDSALAKGSETCGDLVFIKNRHKKYSGRQVFHVDKDEILEKMLADIELDKGFTVPCNTKKQADRIMTQLKQFSEDKGISSSRFKLYTSDQRQIPDDVNIEWSNNFVVYSPTITTGLDFQPDQLQNVYTFIDGENTTSPASVLQMITRNRRINEVYICSTRMNNMPEYTSFEQMCQSLDTLRASRSNLAPQALAKVCTLQELQDCVFNEEAGEDDYSDNVFSKLYRQALWHNDKMRSSFLYQLDGLMEIRGFSINRRTIPQMPVRHAVNAHGVISDREADSLCTQQTEARVKAYFEGRLSNSDEDKHQKGLLDCKVGLLRGISCVDIQNNKEWAEIEYWRKKIGTLMVDNPDDQQVYLDVFSEPQGVNRLRNIKYAAYTDAKLLRMDEMAMKKDFADCSLINTQANHNQHIKAQLLRRLLDIFNSGLPEECDSECTHLKAFDLTLKQASYDESGRIYVPEPLWKSYMHGRRTRGKQKYKPENRRDLMACIVTLSKELFGNKYVVKTKTRARQKGETKNVYNYTANKTVIRVAVEIMCWKNCTESDIESEFAELYLPNLKIRGLSRT